MSKKVIDFDQKSENRKARILGDLMQKSLDFADMTSDDLASGLWDAEIKAFMEATTLKSLFFNEDWVFLVNDLIADLVSRQPMRVFRTVIQANGKEVVEPVDVHPVNTIMENPNELQTYSTWMYNYVVEQNLMGNTVLWKQKVSSNLIIIPAEQVCLDIDDNGKHVGYIVNPQGAGNVNSQANQMHFSIKDIWHQRRPNPASALWGLSPFVPNRKSILFNRYTTDYVNAFYLKGATPGLALNVDKNVSEDAALRLLRSFEMAHTGRRNMRRTLVLPKGVTAEPITPNFTDQSIIDMVNKNEEKIINILKIPKHALSLAKTGSLGSEEHKQALKFLYESAIIPQQNKISEFLSAQFQRTGDLEENEFLGFDNSDVEVLKDDLLKKAELAEKLLQAGWSMNEVRVEIWEKEAVEGGDVIEGVSGQAEEPEDAAPEVDDEAGTPEDDEEIIEQAFGEIDTKELEAREKRIVTKYGEQILASQKQLADDIEETETKTIETWLDIFVGFAEKSVKIVKQELNKLPTRSKADDDKPRKLPPMRNLDAKLARAFDEFQNQWLDFHTDTFNAVMENAYGVTLGFVFNEENLEEIEALRVRDEKGRRSILRARGLDSFKSIKNTSAESVLDVIEDGIKRQRTIGQIGVDIAQKFETSIGRAQTIARTEVATANSLGKVAAMENIAEVLPDVKKVWFNVGDNRVRGPGQQNLDGKPVKWRRGDPNHRRLHLEVQDAKEFFSNGLRYPRDVNAKDAGEVINCRCDMLIVPAEDLTEVI